ncbi:MAG: hypothetical protein QOH88_2493 [Verrucomicrobiota bacterium]|jgi:hypothetical protein
MKVVPLAMLALLLFGPALWAAKPILIGDGRAQISERSIADIQELTRKVLGESASVWMLHCDAYKSGDQTGHVFRVWVYLQPRLKTNRLIRGTCIFCIDQTMQNSWYPESPVVGGWSSTDREPKEYALVSSPQHVFSAEEPWTHPFTVSGHIADADVIAITDIMHETNPDYEITHLVASDATHLRASSYREPGKFLQIDFEKTGQTWHGLKETRLVD